MILKIEDVKVGDDLGCIDIGYFSERSLNSKAEYYLKRGVSVLAIDGDVLIVISGDISESILTVFPNEIQYFKKKEQSQYTFDDLIDVASKAVKDGLFKLIKTDLKSVISLFDSYDFDEEPSLVFHNDEHNQTNHKYIQSLYKETFVIECEDDLKRINLNPKITLNNGEVIPFTFKASAKDHLVFYDQSCGHNLIPFVFLKGATVEQERGCNE